MKLSSKNLTEGVVWKQLLLFFLPIAAGTVIQQLYNAVDGFVVSKYVGTVAFAAVGGSPSQIINVVIGFFTSLTSGASVVIAQIFGAGRREELKKSVGTAVVLCTVLGIAVMVFGLLATDWMLEIMGTPLESVPDAALYLKIYFIGVPFILVLNMESNLLRAVGDSTRPFIYMVASCVVNIILDFWFVKGFHWDVAGAAWATVIAQVVNFALLTYRLLTTSEPYRLSLGELKFRKNYVFSMLKMGVPAGVQSSMYSVSNMIIQISVNTLGLVTVASWAMTGKTDGFYWAITNALGAAITAFIGQNYGAGKTDRVKACVKQGMILSFSVTILLSGLLLLLAKPMLILLTDDQAVRDCTFQIMLYFVPFYFTWSAIEVLTALFRGAGDAVMPVILVGLGICAFRVLWMYTVFAYFGTILSLSLAYLASWVLTDIILIIYYKFGNWRHGLSFAGRRRRPYDETN